MHTTRYTAFCFISRSVVFFGFILRSFANRRLLSVYFDWIDVVYIIYCCGARNKRQKKKLKSRRRSLTWRPNVRTRPRMRDGAKIIINAFRSIKTNDWYVLWNSGHGANACTFPFSVPTTNYLLFFYCFVLSSLFHTRTHAWALYPSQYFTLNEMMVNREHKMWTYVT